MSTNLTPTARSVFHGPLGAMTLAAQGATLVGVWFDGQKHQPDPSTWPWAPESPVLTAAAAQLEAYFAGTLKKFSLPLNLGGGTAFQQSVWRQLLATPHGQTVSYGAIAKALGRPDASRAVGAAVGRNPISIVVPCHRVVGAGGALTGYAGGLDRKTALLQLESTV